MAKAANSVPDKVRRLPIYGAGELGPGYRIPEFVEELFHDTEWPPHAHPTHELLWNDRGLSAATIESRTWTIGPRVALWIPAGTIHTGYAPKGTKYLAAHFDCAEFQLPSTGPIPVEITPLLQLLLDRLFETHLTEDSRTITQRMIVDLLEPTTKSLLVHMPVDELLAPMAHAVMNDPADDRTLAQWAKYLGISERTITRKFIAETGMGYSNWLNAVRAHHAMLMLGAGVEIDDVARLTGYSSINSFGNAFRRTTGLTPSKVRALA